MTYFGNKLVARWWVVLYTNCLFGTWLPGLYITVARSGCLSEVPLYTQLSYYCTATMTLTDKLLCVVGSSCLTA